MIQDILLLEIVKIIIMYAFAIASSRPQLLVIRQVIGEAILSLVQDGHNQSSDVRIVQKYE